MIDIDIIAHLWSALQLRLTYLQTHWLTSMPMKVKVRSHLLHLFDVMMQSLAYFQMSHAEVVARRQWRWSSCP